MATIATVASIPSIASLFVVPVAELPRVVAAGPDSVLESLERHGLEIEDAYFWSGNNLLVMIQHLWRSQKISLFSVARQREERALNGEDSRAAVLIIGPEHKPLLPQIDPATFDLAPVVAGLVAWGVAPAEAQLSVRDGLTLLHHHIAALPDDSVLIIHVGPGA